MLSQTSSELTTKRLGLLAVPVCITGVVMTRQRNIFLKIIPTVDNDVMQQTTHQYYTR
uniref:Uncharacterized protein n=1 Tax=Arabidopsis thaliana TaxID=3702 RepID=Q0WKZ0_ARATH|nr:hypothetical protein [Arabidopsis thaliana]